jgi:hypothetical protein
MAALDTLPFGGEVPGLQVSVAVSPIATLSLFVQMWKDTGCTSAMPGPRSKYLKNAAAPHRARHSERAIPGYTDKSRRYLRLAAEHEKRSADAQSLEVKAKFLEVADQYRDLALQLDDPEKWRAKLTESREAKQK